MVQGDAVVDGVQAVAGGGGDEGIAEAGGPHGVGARQPNPPVQDLQCGLAGALVVVEAGAGGQGNQGLSQCVLVPAVHGVRAGGCRGGGGRGGAGGRGGRVRGLGGNGFFHIGGGPPATGGGGAGVAGGGAQMLSGKRGQHLAAA